MSFFLQKGPPVAIVGAGPVGSALALFLDRRGVPVVLLDGGKSESKICGEGILPAGWEVLEHLGISNLLELKAPIRGLRYTIGGPTGARNSMTASLRRSAFGVQRPVLVEAFQAALANSQVELHYQTQLRDFEIDNDGVELHYTCPGNKVRQMRCQYLIGADGLHSLVRRKASLVSSRQRLYKRWGTRCYFHSEEHRDQVEVTLGDGVESYLTPLGGGLYGLAFLWSPERLGRPLPGEGPTFRRLLPYLPAQLLPSLPPPSSDFFEGERAIGPLEQFVTSPLHRSGRVALVGDAAGYLDALTGEGLCLGLRQAESLSQCLLEDRLPEYPREHQHIKARHNFTVGGLLWLIHRPQFRDRVFSALAASPRQFEAVIRFAVEEAGFTTLLSPDLPQFLWHLLNPN